MDGWMDEVEGAWVRYRKERSMPRTNEQRIKVPALDLT